MQTSLFERVRSSCKAVSERARTIHVNHNLITEYAANLPLNEIISPEHDKATHYLGVGKSTVAYFVTLNAINFGSGYFPRLKKRPGMSGYFTVASSLTDHYRNQGVISARALSDISTADCIGIFQQDPENTDIRELMAHFSEALNQLGHYLIDRFEGEFTNLVEAADRSAETLASLMIEMPYFNDIASYQDLTVSFFKRAQLLSADLDLALSGQRYGRFRDLSRLTIFADNLVPHVLQRDGILTYEESLLDAIRREDLVPSGSEEEIEIRACAVHAVELLVESLQRKGQEITAKDLDFLLWNRGQKPEYKAHPRHRTRTVFY